MEIDTEIITLPELPLTTVLIPILEYLCYYRPLTKVLKLRAICRTLRDVIDTYVLPSLPQRFKENVETSQLVPYHDEEGHFTLKLPCRLHNLVECFPTLPLVLKFRGALVPGKLNKSRRKVLLKYGERFKYIGFRVYPYGMTFTNLSALESLVLKNGDKTVDYSMFSNAKKLKFASCSLPKKISLFSNARRLKITYCSTKLDLTPPPLLKSISLRSIHTLDVSPLRHLQKVGLSHIGFLKNLQDLRSIPSISIVCCDGVTDVSFLKDVPHVYLGCLHNVGGVSQLTGVQELTLHRMTGLHLTPLTLPKVKKLTISETPIFEEKESARIYQRPLYREELIQILPHVHETSKKESRWKDIKSKFDTNPVVDCHLCNAGWNVVFLHICPIVRHAAAQLKRYSISTDMIIQDEEEYSLSRSHWGNFLFGSTRDRSIRHIDMGMITKYKE